MTGGLQARSVISSQLLNVFENESEGPIELDTTLLYGSPTSVGSGAGSSLRRTWSRSTLDHDVIGRAEPIPPDSHLSHKLRPRLEQSHFLDFGPLRDCTTDLNLGDAQSFPLSDKQRHVPPTKKANLVALQERLLRKAQARDQKLARLRSELESQALEECTFEPTLTSRRDEVLGPDYPTLITRVTQIQRKKEQATTIKNLQDQETFQPSLNTRSLHLAEQRRRRLEEEGLSNDKRSPLVDVEPGTAVQFEPTINVTSRRLLETSSRIPAFFEERQRYFAQLKDERLAQEETEKKVEEGSFQPRIIHYAGVALPQETAEERAHRMAIVEPAKAEARRRAAQQEEATVYTFQPKLNPHSQKLGRKSGLEVLVPAKVPQRHGDSKGGVSKIQEQIRPETLLKLQNQSNREDSKTEPPSELLERLNKQAAKRQAWIEEERRRQEAKLLAECTFQPKVNASGSTRKIITTSPVDDPIQPKAIMPAGLDRYMELRQRAVKKKEEAEARAAEVFGLKRQHCGRSSTVPKPFQLAGVARSAAQRAQRETALESVLKAVPQSKARSG